MWERRPRPHVPVWNFTKVPRPNLSPEENARLLSLYMRPWTLNPHAATENTPLLSKLRECMIVDGQEVGIAQGDGNNSQLACDSRSGFQPRDDQGNRNAEDATGSSSHDGAKGPKRRRLRGKQGSAKPSEHEIRKSYAATWQQYIDGRIVSESSCRYIMNLLSATAARVVERTADSGEESSESDVDRFKGHAGSLDLVHKTLQGIAAQDEDEGQPGFGRHAAAIRMGRDLWETPELNVHERGGVAEHFSTTVHSRTLSSRWTPPKKQ
jgi:hypothetical protein